MKRQQQTMKTVTTRQCPALRESNMRPTRRRFTVQQLQLDTLQRRRRRRTTPPTDGHEVHSLSLASNLCHELCFSPVIQWFITRGRHIHTHTPVKPSHLLLNRNMEFLQDSFFFFFFFFKKKLKIFCSGKKNKNNYNLQEEKSEGKNSLKHLLHEHMRNK